MDEASAIIREYKRYYIMLDAMWDDNEREYIPCYSLVHGEYGVVEYKDTSLPNVMQIAAMYEDALDAMDKGSTPVLTLVPPPEDRH